MAKSLMLRCHCPSATGTYVRHTKFANFEIDVSIVIVIIISKDLIDVDLIATCDDSAH